MFLPEDTRGDFVAGLDARVLADLNRFGEDHDGALNAWLAGPAADDDAVVQSPEYQAFSVLWCWFDEIGV